MSDALVRLRQLGIGYPDNDVRDNTNWACGEIERLRIERSGLRDENERLQAVIEESHDWYCGCGHWNGPNLAECGMCGRTPYDTV